MDKGSNLLAESVNWITRTCMIIEKIETLNKSSLRNMDIMEKRINSLELEIRIQGDLA